VFFIFHFVHKFEKKTYEKNKVDTHQNQKMVCYIREGGDLQVFLLQIKKSKHYLNIYDIK
jgi:hypothetical protein